jgi:hypothetical protein
MTGTFALGILTIVVLAPKQPGAEPADPTDSPAVQAAEDQRDATEAATADDLLRELQRRRPANEPIPPASAAGGEFPPHEPKLWPEGWTVVDVVGRLSRSGSWWTLLGESSRFAGPIKLLPDSSLEVMVRTATAAAVEVPFIIAGDMTVYAGENYLLVRDVRRARPPQANTSGPSGAPSDVVAPDAPVDDVLAVLKAREPDNPVLQAGQDGFSAGSVAYTPGLVPDGTLMASRAGRVVRQDEWWLFIFESDHPDHREPPMKLLPNLVTATMVTAVEQEGVGAVFLVSGEVTQFAGENFLLPQFATRRVEMGNLRP